MRSSSRTPSSRRHRIRAAAVPVAAVVGVLSLAACGGDDEPTVEAAAETPAAQSAAEFAVEPGLVTPQQALTLVENGVTVIDLRTPEEYAEGHLAGSTLIDFYEPDFGDRLSALDPEQPYVIYCRSGNRSAQAYDMMAELGFDAVYDVDGGVLAMAAAGLPLVD